MVSFRLMLGEIFFIALAGLAALVVNVIVGFFNPTIGLTAGLIVLFAVAGLLALWRLRDAERLGHWLRRIADPRHVEAQVDEAAVPEFGGPLRDMVRPAYDVAQMLARRDQQLQQQEAALSRIVAVVPDPILLVDRDRTVQLANPAAERSFKVRLQGLSLARAVRDPGVLAAVDSALGAGIASNVTFSPTIERTRQYSARVLPMTLGDGRPGVLLAMREQSEQLLIERMRSDFVANASHEIRTPLASIIGITETLRGPARDDAVAREMFLDTMAEEAGRMQRLIDDLLSLSRIEFAANQPPKGEVDPRQLVHEVVDRMGHAASHAQVTAEVEADMPFIRGDRDQLHQLLFNLVDNAVKYGAGKPVEIQARYLAAAGSEAGPMSGRPGIELSVRDHGEGIAAEHLGRLTERFYRVDKARSRRIGGTGLGLAIVKHIVRRHQGHLGIESKLAEGSRFYAILPMAEENGVEEAPWAGLAAVPMSRKTVTIQS